MTETAEHVVPVRAGAPRDRHGRGVRGPLVLAGPLTHGGAPHIESRRDQFDEIVLTLVDRHLRRWADALGDIEFGTEDVPELPEDWQDEAVPFGALTRPRDGQPGRIVVFRRPVEMRARTRLERVALVDEILVEHIADQLGKDPSEIDP
ncbi:MAG: metallopeptidase family protein [Nocardioidaceae bacterium]